MVMIQHLNRSARAFDPLDHGFALAEGSLGVDMRDPPCFFALESTGLQLEMEAGRQHAIRNKNKVGRYLQLHVPPA